MGRNPKPTEGSSVSRRRFLKTTSALGVSLVGIQGVQASDDVTELVLTRNEKGPVETRAVPTEWYEHTQKAKKAAKNLGKTLTDHQEIVSVGIGTEKDAIGGLRKKKIEVDLRGDSTTATIQDHKDGIPVQVNRNASAEYHCYEGSYDPLRGGISVENASGATGSICAKVYDDNWNERLMTARHVFTDNGVPCGSISDDSAHRNGDEIGSVSHSSEKHDMALVSLNSSHDINDSIVAESADVKGWVTESGLDTYSSDGTTLNKRGVTTCKETYTIDSYGHTNDPGCSPDHIDIVHYDDGNADPGDSGGPIYHVDDEGDAYLSSILSGEYEVSCGWFCSKDVVFGSAVYAIRNEGNIRIA